MKKLLYGLCLMLHVTCLSQGTLVFDQQSSTDETYSSGGVRIQFYGFVGQSFTPSFSTVGFVRLRLVDFDLVNGVGAMLVMNLRSNAINGPILGTTTLTLGNGFSGSKDFIFAAAIPVVPSMTYFFETSVVAGDSWGIRLIGDDYPNGIVYGGLTGATGNDLWFREGIIVVPEPTLFSLLILGGLGVCYGKRRR